MSKPTKRKLPSDKENLPVESPDQPIHVPRGVFKGIFIVSSIILVLLLIYRPAAVFSGPKKIAEATQISIKPNTGPQDDCELPTTRYSIYTGQTACYPSSGGIWVSDLGPVELQYLGINRFNTTLRSLYQVEEDMFCRELRKFGGGWYNPKSGKELLVGGYCHEIDEFKPVYSIVRAIGFEQGGGVWVLGAERTGRFPAGMVAVGNALNMAERTMALRSLGAVYCADVVGCGLLEDLSKEPYELARER
ncbi:hypothetical protein ASPVEDRAFT_48025 [Aspergillus versicolor CBS 583.65]|uniref:Uncharacterized protein n=1 Tax=Aspergillus versicolor CBS 583.65 TaxID=1036611 RepID=A0A1L9Q541_ASPVE|nr:uncharacterized protein ASPVEDRAFT_48025 [Aspergillus versicolor CBS 583.65]OJJ08895.1 hypothetical protein ASPVEDRAFT_48025 [Aspergillus versicolor CBS 583.65]